MVVWIPGRGPNGDNAPAALTVAAEQPPPRMAIGEHELPSLPQGVLHGRADLFIRMQTGFGHLSNYRPLLTVVNTFACPIWAKSRHISSFTPRPSLLLTFLLLT
jgi:hypothetical protein